MCADSWTIIDTGVALSGLIAALAGIILAQGRDMRDRFVALDRKVDKLADDHNALARELSEVKGYLRGTLPESLARG